MIKSYLKTVLIAIGLAMGCVSAWAQETTQAIVKMTYVNNDAPDTSYGEIATGEVAKSGYNKISGGANCFCQFWLGCQLYNLFTSRRL